MLKIEEKMQKQEESEAFDFHSPGQYKREPHLKKIKAAW